MACMTTSDGIRLHFEETGRGRAVLFLHEFSGDHRAWEPQVRYFCRRYRCITFSARGYPPSDVPERIEMYSQRRAVDDAKEVLDHLDIERAHVVGLSMGGFTAMNFGIHHPERALSIVIGGSASAPLPTTRDASATRWSAWRNASSVRERASSRRYGE